MKGLYKNSLAFAQQADEKDPLKAFRDRFYIPRLNDKDVIYFTGNSLGLQPKTTKIYIEEELNGWATLGVDGHFHSQKRPWFYYHKFSKETLAKIVGAKPSEVVSMNNLTTNLHLMMVSFYRPTAKRYKIMIEAGAFPSDQYAVESQLKFHGFDYEDALIAVAPRPGEFNIRTEDILEAIDAHKDHLALVLFGGVQYYTGQFFAIEKITAAGHTAGAFVGFDLAHAAGNVPLKLHTDNVDFAIWCSYKYLNSGPGGVSGIFVHEQHGNKAEIPRFAGWWGHDERERFKMEKRFKPMPGADGWQLSNVNVIGSAAHLAALEIYNEAGMEALREKSIKLTGYLEFLLKNLKIGDDILRIITPSEAYARGCQLSLSFSTNGKAVFEHLTRAGVVADWREPNLAASQSGVIRVAPVPLYNTFEDVYNFCNILKKVIF